MNDNLTLSERASDPRTVIILPEVRMNEERYVIRDFNTGVLINDAQGYGFRTEDKALAYAHKPGWIIKSINSIENNILF